MNNNTSSLELSFGSVESAGPSFNEATTSLYPTHISSFLADNERQGRNFWKDYTNPQSQFKSLFFHLTKFHD